MDQNAKRSIIAGLYGNTLEWYDFLLYASFAPLFAKVFFTTGSYFISLVETFAVFAIGFLMRPIGGVLLGHYADHVGRRKALIVSIAVMTAATTAIAFLPAYQSAGIMAPILFIFLRLVQGLAVGGELPSSATFLMEHTPVQRRGFVGSLVLSTAFLGIFFGSMVAAFLSETLTEAHLFQWGWRLGYLLGGVLGVVGIYLRLKSQESSTFTKAELLHEWPITTLLKSHRYNLLLSIIFTGALAVGNYILVAYATTFLVKAESFSLGNALLINFIAIFMLTVFIPCMGFLSDRFGRKALFISGVLGMFLLVFPIFWLLASGSWWYALWSQLLLALVLSPINATVPTILAERFPTAVRASGVSVGYNIGQAVFGGTVPLVGLILVEMTGNKLAPAWYIFAWALLAIVMMVKSWRDKNE
jgi:proline/betaine transport protein TphA